MSASNGCVLTLERVIRAQRPVVYDAMTTGAELVRWWGPHGFRIADVEFVPEVGRGYRIGMQPPEGDPFRLYGMFREVDPPSRLAYTFLWEPPDPDDRETVVELSLEDRGDQTEIHFTQGQFATEERRALHEGGWTDSFEKLERLLVR